MTKKPKVSIILTSYNHENFIRQSIESALDQTYKDFELIIIDDHSTDNSWKIINEYQDKRISSIRNERNQRFGVIRQATKKHATGDFLAILHSDDVWESTKLEKQINFLLDHQNIAAVFTHAKIINENNQSLTIENHPYINIFNQPNRSRFEWLRYFFYNGNGLCNPSSVRRRSFVENIEPYHGFLQLPDLSLWIQLCFKHDIHVLQEELIRFRVLTNNSNWSGDNPSNRIRVQYETFRILDHYKKISSKEELLKIFPTAQNYISEKYVDILFALGMIAIETGKNEATHLFGLNLLFDALNDSERARKLKSFQGFDIKTFFDLTKKHDIFSIEKVRNLEKELGTKEQEVLFYSESKSWRYTAFIRKFTQWLKK